MSARKHYSLSAQRKIAILKRAALIGCLFNRKWCFALTTEPAAKWLLKKGMIRLEREGPKRSKFTMGRITPEGIKYLKLKGIDIEAEKAESERRKNLTTEQELTEYIGMKTLEKISKRK